MGYESTLFIVQQHTRIPDFDPVQSGSVIAAVDLSKTGYDTPVGVLIAESISEHKKALKADRTHPVGFYTPGGDGDTVVSEDKYGDPVTPLAMEPLINALRASEEQEHYRRFALAIAVLEPFTTDDWPNRPAVLHFGH